MGVESAGIDARELVEPPPADGPELAGIELDGPAGVGVTHIPEADVQVSGVEPARHALRHEQRLARQAIAQWRREAHVFAALAATVDAGSSPGSTCPPVGNHRSASRWSTRRQLWAAESTSTKYATRCLGGVAGLAVRQIGAPLRTQARASAR